MSANASKSARVRAKLNHPIIDTDGHTVEFTPVFFDYTMFWGQIFTFDILVRVT